MTTTTPAPVVDVADRDAAEPAPADDVVAARAATHRVVDDLVRAGLPTPARHTVTEYGRDDRCITLTFRTDAELDLWADELSSVDVVPRGPWRIGPEAYRVRVGRLGGIPTVLRVPAPLDEVPDVALASDPAATGDQPRDPATTSTAQADEEGSS